MSARYFAIGSFAAFLALGLHTPRASAGPYEQLLQMTEYEQQFEQSELAIQQYVPLVMQDRTELEIEERHVDLALTNKPLALCSNPQETEGQQMIMSECARIEQQIREVAKREAWIRGLGRDLQLIATSYEPDTDGHTGRDNEMSTKLPKAIYWWQSGVDKMTNPVEQVRVRMEEAPDDIDDNISTIGSILSGLVKTDTAGGTDKKDISELVAAIHRYRNGYYDVRYALDESRDDSCSDDSDDTGELYLLTKRWCDIEDELHAIWEELPDLDLAPTEIAVFPVQSVSAGELTDVVVWMHAGDVGLLWRRPLEPVLPAMLDANTEPILGGTYPEPPEPPAPRHGTCSHAFAQRGYLCRAQRRETCPVDQEQEPNENIQLIGCDPYEFDIRQTESGPNLCNTGGWRTPVDPEEMKRQDTPNKDRRLKADNCENCIVDLYCGDCSGGETYEKNDKGVIEVCVSQDIPMDPRYIIIHELVHAQELCNLPPNTPFNPASAQSVCCTVEYYPYIVSCKAMAEDGVLDTTNFTIEECAMMLANASCSDWDYACTGEPDDPDAYDQRFQELVEAIRDDNPPSCTEAVQDIDPRALSIKESLKMSCRPECEIEYDNTIGNNLCYIGQCVEESLEEHRLVPGRIPFVTQDEAFPWDSCIQDNPKNDAVMAVPPLTPTFLPSYRGQELVQSLDLLLCQINGLPRLSPPVLCGFQPSRRLSLPLTSFYRMGVSFTEQESENTKRTSELQQSTGNIGARIGTEFYRRYMHKAIREFAALVRAANLSVRTIGETTFPQVTCPRNHTGGCEIFR